MAGGISNARDLTGTKTLSIFENDKSTMVNQLCRLIDSPAILSFSLL